MTSWRSIETSVETSTGRYVDLANPDPGTITLEDIAAHLSRIGRFNGACQRFYSVAEHALLVADRLRALGHGAATILRGLHHDDHEAYSGDKTRPYKLAVRAVGGPASCGPWEEINERLDQAIVQALDLPDLTVEAWQAIKQADNWALAAEAYHLLPSRGRGWVVDGLYDPDEPRVIPIPGERRLAYRDGVPCCAVEVEFLRAHARWHAHGGAA